MEGDGGVRVLVVDDRADAAELLVRVLSAAGFRAAAVADRRRALRVVATEHVAVVAAAHGPARLAATTDLVTSLRSRPEPPLRDVGLVVLLDDAADARFGLGAEADAVVVRPVDAGDLVDEVTDVAATDPAARALRRAGALRREESDTPIG